MKLPATYLFVPGNRPERFAKALASGADAVILDLEDAVAPHDKDDARVNIRHWAEAHPDLAAKVVVRINDGATPWFRSDLELFSQSGMRLAMLPKVETPEAIGIVRSALPAEGRVLPIIESARGVDNANAIAAAYGVQRLVFGTLDYGVDLNLSGDDRGIAYAASRMAIASRCAGLAAPVAGITAAIDDDARLAADLEFARAFGFGAKLCIHPRQLAAIDAAFRPSAAEVDWARRVVAAAAGTSGAFVVDGRMVDRPVVLKAQSILDRAAPSTAAP